MRLSKRPCQGNRAGPHDREEAIAVFSDHMLAQQYIDEAGWENGSIVAAIEPIPFLKWLLQAHEKGVQSAVVDPDFSDHQKPSWISARRLRI
jgi:hypothetical protein